MRNVVALAVALVALSHGDFALAKPLGAEGQFALAAENVTSASFVSIAGEDSSTEQTYFSLLTHARPTTPYDVPRFALDYLLSDHVTLGGALGYAHLSPDGGDSESTFLIHPRVGYLVPLGSTVNLWLRGGLTYYNAGTDEVTRSGLGGHLSGMFAFGLAGNFAILFGPAADIGILGDLEIDGVGDTDARITSLSLNAGLLGWLF